MEFREQVLDLLAEVAENNIVKKVLLIHFKL